MILTLIVLVADALRSSHKLVHILAVRHFRYSEYIYVSGSLINLISLYVNKKRKSRQYIQSIVKQPNPTTQHMNNL